MISYIPVMENTRKGFHEDIQNLQKQFFVNLAIWKKDFSNFISQLIAFIMTPITVISLILLRIFEAFTMIVVYLAYIISFKWINFNYLIRLISYINEKVFVAKSLCLDKVDKLSNYFSTKLNEMQSFLSAYLVHFKNKYDSFLEMISKYVTNLKFQVVNFYNVSLGYFCGMVGFILSSFTLSVNLFVRMAEAFCLLSISTFSRFNSIYFGFFSYMKTTSKITSAYIEDIKLKCHAKIHSFTLKSSEILSSAKSNLTVAASKFNVYILDWYDKLLSIFSELHKIPNIFNEKIHLLFPLSIIFSFIMRAIEAVLVFFNQIFIRVTTMVPFMAPIENMKVLLSRWLSSKERILYLEAEIKKLKGLLATSESEYANQRSYIKEILMALAAEKTANDLLLEEIKFKLKSKTTDDKEVLDMELKLARSLVELNGKTGPKSPSKNEELDLLYFELDSTKTALSHTQNELIEQTLAFEEFKDKYSVKSNEFVVLEINYKNLEEK